MGSFYDSMQGWSHGFGFLFSFSASGQEMRTLKHFFLGWLHLAPCLFIVSWGRGRSLLEPGKIRGLHLIP